MALYPVPTEGYNGINQNLFPFSVSSKLFREWVQITPLFNLMGDEPSRPIVRKQLKKGEGLQYRMGKLQALDYKNPITNFSHANVQNGRVFKVMGGYSKCAECRGAEALITVKRRKKKLPS